MTGKPENFWRSLADFTQVTYIIRSCSLRFSIILLAIE
jgi:hypothetical protein